MGYMKGQERMRRIGGRIHNGRAWDAGESVLSHGSDRCIVRGMHCVLAHH